jgi:hypothetical protein
MGFVEVAQHGVSSKSPVMVTKSTTKGETNAAFDAHALCAGRGDGVPGWMMDATAPQHV